jgi:hypothetical protein
MITLSPGDEAREEVREVRADGVSVDGVWVDGVCARTAPASDSDHVERKSVMAVGDQGFGY